MAKKKTNKKVKKKADAQVMPQASGRGLPPVLFNTKVMCGVLFLFSFLLYANTFGHQFTQDDAIVLTDNDYTKKGVGGIKELLIYDTFRGFFKVEGKDNLVEGGRYRPLTPIMFAVGYEMFGDNATPYHIMNVFWYGLTVVMLYILLLKMLNEPNAPPKDKVYAYLVPLAAAALFAAHPIHVEAVANIKGRDEIMTLLLSMAATYFVFKAIDDKPKGILNMLWAALLFFLALMAKEMAAVFIPILAISIFIFRKESIPQSLLLTYPFLIGFAAFMVIRTAVLGWSLGGESQELMNNPFLGMTGEQKYAAIFYALGKYFKLLWLPHPLTHDYYPYAIPVTRFGDPIVGMSMLLYLTLIAAAAWGVLRRNHIAYGIAFFLISLFLVSNIPVNIGANMAERFLFMPSVGFCWVVAVLLYLIIKKGNKDVVGTTAQKLQPAAFVLMALLLLGAGKTVIRNMDWADNFTLFYSDWEKSKNSAKARNSVGGALSEKSQKEGVKGTPEEQRMLNEAVGHLTEAARIHPTYKSAYFLRGNVHFYLKEYEKSVADYGQALAIDPGYADALQNMEIAQKALNEEKQQAANDAEDKVCIDLSNQKRYDEAIVCFTQLSQKYPKSAKYPFFIGVAHLSKGDANAALPFLLKAEQLDPGSDPDNMKRVLAAIADTYARLGDAAKAAEYQAKLGG